MPERGVKYLDTDTDRVVTYIGDCGHGPQWREADGTWFYCDWLDWYLWKRFRPLRTRASPH